MKTDKQIKAYLSDKQYKSETDFKAISFICKDDYNIKLGKPDNFNEEDGMDFSDFSNWIKSGIAPGNVVVNAEGILYLAHKISKKSVVSCAHISDGKFYVESNELPIDSVKRASAEDEHNFYKTLSSEGKEFGESFMCLTEKFRPSSSNLVKFENVITGEYGAGIVRIINYQTDEVYMYCYYLFKPEDPKPILKYGMNEYLGMFYDFEFKPTESQSYERKRLKTYLKAVGKIWNGRISRIEPLNFNHEGQIFYYINETFGVASRKWAGTPSVSSKYIAGNMFWDEMEAVKFAEEIVEMRRNMLRKPENIENIDLTKLDIDENDEE